uniref:Uncharacterized protein n=1 Tax=Echinococcus granulosus TaxID=6210 RepID=A0A068X4S5_ECHGR|nr:hypothetical protein EgrG_002054000 [Echinococcus granulosus]
MKLHSTRRSIRPTASEEADDRLSTTGPYFSNLLLFFPPIRKSVLHTSTVVTPNFPVAITPGYSFSNIHKRSSSKLEATNKQGKEDYFEEEEAPTPQVFKVNSAMLALELEVSRGTLNGADLTKY